MHDCTCERCSTSRKGRGLSKSVLQRRPVWPSHKPPSPCDKVTSGSARLPPLRRSRRCWLARLWRKWQYWAPASRRRSPSDRTAALVPNTCGGATRSLARTLKTLEDLPDDFARLLTLDVVVARGGMDQFTGPHGYHRAPWERARSATKPWPRSTHPTALLLASVEEARTRHQTPRGVSQTLSVTHIKHHVLLS